MSSARPVLDCDLNSKARELLVVAEAHRNVLHVENYQRGPTHLPNRRVWSCYFTNRLLLDHRCDILLDKVDRELARGGYSSWLGSMLRNDRLLVAPTPILLIIVIVSPAFRATSIIVIRVVRMIWRLQLCLLSLCWSLRQRLHHLVLVLVLVLAVIISIGKMVIFRSWATFLRRRALLSIGDTTATATSISAFAIASRAIPSARGDWRALCGPILVGLCLESRS